MTQLTGFSDTFGRTVAAGGWGTPTNFGTAYTVSGTAADWSVGSNLGVVTPSALAATRTANSDGNATQWNLLGLWKISALPASGTVRAGLIGGWIDSNNYYRAYALVTSAGAVSVVIEKVVAGAATALFTGGAISGLTIAANTIYNLRFSGFYNFVTRQYTLGVKLWATTEPGGYNGSAVDGALFGGTQLGVMVRNDGPAATITFSYSALTESTFSLPTPAGTDPMCYDPTVAFPRQTAVQSLAAAVDTVVAGFDPDAARAALFSRVRVSVSNFTVDSSLGSITFPFTTSEFNIGTSTDLSLDQQSLYLPVGVWLVTGEVAVAPAASDYFFLQLIGTNVLINEFAEVQFRSNPTQLNNQGVGGTGKVGTVVSSTDPVTPRKLSLVIQPNSASAIYTATYAALTAIEISDLFA